MKKYAIILPDSFVPDLKNLLPEVKPEESVLAVDRGLPKISGHHKESDVMITKKERRDPEQPADTSYIVSDLESRIQLLNSDLKEVETRNVGLEMKLAGLKLELSVQRERVVLFEPERLLHLPRPASYLDQHLELLQFAGPFKVGRGEEANRGTAPQDSY